jgi:hypothetical protein
MLYSACRNRNDTNADGIFGRHSGVVHGGVGRSQ